VGIAQLDLAQIELALDVAARFVVELPVAETGY